MKKIFFATKAIAILSLSFNAVANEQMAIKNFKEELKEVEIAQSELNLSHPTITQKENTTIFQYDGTTILVDKDKSIVQKSDILSQIMKNQPIGKVYVEGSKIVYSGALGNIKADKIEDFKSKLDENRIKIKRKFDDIKIVETNDKVKHIRVVNIPAFNLQNKDTTLLGNEKIKKEYEKVAKIPAVQIAQMAGEMIEEEVGGAVLFSVPDEKHLTNYLYVQTFKPQSNGVKGYNPSTFYLNKIVSF